MTEPKKKPEVLHVRKFDHANGGRRTPAEVHRELGLGGAKCTFCGDPAGMKGMVYAEADEYAKRDPQGFMVLYQRVGGDPSFDSKYGRIVKVQEVFGCDRCKKAAVHFLAKKPDWMFTEIDEMGLDSSHPTQVAVPG